MPVGDWNPIWLAIIAFSTLTMALVQVGAALAAMKAAKEVNATVTGFKRDLQPLLDDGRAFLQSARNTSEAAAEQLGRVQELAEDAGDKMRETRRRVEQTVMRPVRQAQSLLTAAQTFVSVLRGRRPAPRRLSVDDRILREVLQERA